MTIPRFHYPQQCPQLSWHLLQHQFLWSEKSKGNLEECTDGDVIDLIFFDETAASRVSKGSFTPKLLTEPYPESSSGQAVNLSIHTALQDASTN
jgi:hypothetical protein